MTLLNQLLTLPADELQQLLDAVAAETGQRACQNALIRRYPIPRNSAPDRSQHDQERSNACF